MNKIEFSKAIYNLANVLENYDRRGKSKEFGAMHAACQLVARVQGFYFFPLPKNIDHPHKSEEVELIASHSHIQFRKIKLSGDWWEKSNSPLITYQIIQNVKQPVALIQNESGSYEIRNTTTNETTILTNDNARTLDEFGWVFYPSFGPEKKTIASILSFLNIDKNDLQKLFFISLALGIILMSFHFAIGNIVDSIIPSASSINLFWLCGLLLVATLAIIGFRLTQSFIYSRIMIHIDSLLIPAIWDHVLKLPVSFFRRFQAGDLILRIYSILNIRNLFGVILYQGITFLTLICCLCVMFWISSSLTEITVFLILFYLCINAFFTYISTKNSIQISNLSGKLSSIVLHYLIGIHKIRITHSQERVFNNWSEIYAKKESLTYKNQTFMALLNSINDVFPIVSTLILFFSVTIAYPDIFKLDVGKFLIFLAAFTEAIYLLIHISYAVMSSVESIIPEIQRIKPLLDCEPEVNKNKLFPGTLTGRIDINQVTFSYEKNTPHILSSLSLKIEPGEFVGIAGESGSGKSTLLRLLLGFEKPNSGSIFYDDYDLSEIDISAVRRQIGVVLQNGQLVAGSIYQNIVGSLPYSVDDAWEVARLCGLDKDILNMPMGMHTWVCEGAFTLSGGQRQLLLIARALITKPKILFFDEATSVLDNDIQALITENLTKLKVTKVIIAHRLSTLEKTNKIVAMKDGKVVETGSYHELIARNGFFASLVRRQRN